MNKDTCVQLRSARIPSIPGLIADHFWFVIEKQGDGDTKDRWEIWQSQDCGGESWCHLHKNLKPYADNVGVGKSKKIQQWFGDDAKRLITHIERSAHHYPYQNKYRYWPGPNSNTYVQWILDQAEIDYMLGSSAIGKDYQPGLINIQRSDGYFQLSSPLFGLKINWPLLFELHFLTLSVGISRQPLHVTIPFFRF